jgi:phosphocarrier protein HPr
MMLRARKSEPSHLVTKELTVINKEGLHARPAVAFVRTAIAFKSSITIIRDDSRYAANRIMDVLLANLQQGSIFTLEALGSDAHLAVEKLEALLKEFLDQEEQEQAGSKPPKGGLRNFFR